MDTPTRPAAPSDSTGLDIVSLAAPRVPVIAYGDIIPMPEPWEADWCEFTIANDKGWGDVSELDAKPNPARITYRSGEVEWFASLGDAERSVDRDCYIDDERVIRWSAGGTPLGQIEETYL